MLSHIKMNDIFYKSLANLVSGVEFEYFVELHGKGENIPVPMMRGKFQCN